MKSVTEFESEIQPKIRDTSGGTVTTEHIRQSLNRGIRELINDHGVYATKDKSEVALFPSVYEYPLPSNFHSPISLQTPTLPKDIVRTTPAEFWRNFVDNTMAFDSQKGTHTLLAKIAPNTTSKIAHTCDSLTANGTWAVEGATDAETLSIDSANYKTSPGVLSFNVTVGLSGNNYAAIENSTMMAVDLTNYSGKSTAFVWAYIPSITNLTSFTLRWGSDSSNYYSKTVTAQYNGLAFRNGWNRIGFAWSSATPTGSPTVTAINYLNLRVTYTGSYTSQVGFLVDDIRFENPTYIEIHYYSTDFTQTTGGTLQASFVNSSDQSLLNDSDDDFLFWHALADAKEIIEDESGYNKAIIEKKSALQRIKGRFQSEKKKDVKFY